MRSLCFLAVCLLVGCSSPPDDRMIARFNDHRDAFEQLRAMMMEDSFRVVRDDWMAPRKGRDEHKGEPHPSISDARWNQYRGKFRELGLDAGITRADTGPCQLYFLSYAAGIVAAGETKGYAYCESAPSPLVTDLDKDPVPPKATGYRSIDGKWYLFGEVF